MAHHAAFGFVARHVHAVSVPPYSEVMRVDGILLETWKHVPEFMKVRPLEESVTDPPMQVIQRFGLATLWLKGRCVLHRRYLSEVPPRREHAYSRRACLDAALVLLEHQQTLHQACKPGALLYTKNWFISSLTINDFLLSGMVVALVLQSEHYNPDDSGRCEWMSPETTTEGPGAGAEPPPPPLPTKDELLRVLQNSCRVWTTMAQTVPDAKKAEDVVRTLLGRIYAQLGIQPDSEFADMSASAGSAGAGAVVTQQTQQTQQYRQVDGYGGAESIAGLTLHGDGSTSSGGSRQFPISAPVPTPMTATTSSVSPEVLNYSISPDYEMVDPDAAEIAQVLGAGQPGPSWMVYGDGEYDWVSGLFTLISSSFGFSSSAPSMAGC